MVHTWQPDQQKVSAHLTQSNLWPRLLALVSNSLLTPLPECLSQISETPAALFTSVSRCLAGDQRTAEVSCSGMAIAQELCISSHTKLKPQVATAAFQKRVNRNSGAKGSECFQLCDFFWRVTKKPARGYMTPSGTYRCNAELIFPVPSPKQAEVPRGVLYFLSVRSGATCLIHVRQNIDRRLGCFSGAHQAPGIVDGSLCYEIFHLLALFGSGGCVVHATRPPPAFKRHLEIRAWRREKRLGMNTDWEHLRVCDLSFNTLKKTRTPFLSFPDLKLLRPFSVNKKMPVVRWIDSPLLLPLYILLCRETHCMLLHLWAVTINAFFFSFV